MVIISLIIYFVFTTVETKKVFSSNLLIKLKVSGIMYFSFWFSTEIEISGLLYETKISG